MSDEESLSDDDVMPGEVESDPLYSAAVVLDDLKHPSAKRRLSAMRELRLVSLALGDRRTREDLLPFLHLTIDDDDDVLEELALQLGSMLDDVGGEEHASSIFRLLKVLCAADASAVRRRAVVAVKELATSISQLGAEQSHAFALDTLLPTVRYLTANEYCVARVSACELLPITCSLLTHAGREGVVECLRLFRALVRTRSPVVRRAAASTIGELIKEVWEIEASLVETELLEDDQDSVRLVALPAGLVLFGFLRSDSRDALVIPLLRAVGSDKAWRVRYLYADLLVDFCDCVSSTGVRDELLPTFLVLLRDNEAEVRTIATKRSAQIARRLIVCVEDDPVVSGEEMAVRCVLPVIKPLVHDSSQHVRAALASSVMELSVEFSGTDNALDLKDTVLTLLKDDFPEVRLNVISRIQGAVFLRNTRYLSSELLPAIMDLAEDRNWRVRLAIIEHVPLLAQLLGTELFNDEMKLSHMCLTWLGDCVWSIREAAINNLKRLTEIFGAEWAQRSIVPKIIDLFNTSTNYLYRMTALYAMGVLSSVLAEESNDDFLTMLISQACRDSVPNVRFSAAKSLGRIAPHVREAQRETKIRPCLEGLVNGNETDKEVVNFARQALQSLATM